MSTRSMIGIQNKNGSIEAIWCHWDGYPSHNGTVLLDRYTTAKSARALINEGNRESLDHDEGVGLKLDETGTKNFFFKDRETFLAFDGWQEFSYLRVGRSWMICSNGKTFHKLTREICNEG